MQKKLLVAVLGTLFAIPALADDAPYTITTNVGFVTDYTFRGISQTFREPAIQGGIDFNHKNGLYLGTWASNISSNQYTNANMEWDFYGGYNGTVNEDLGYSLGLITVYYPGGVTSTTAPTRKWDTTEWNIGATWKGLNVKYSQTLTNWYGVDATGGGFNPSFWTAADTAITGATGATTANSAAANSKGSGYIEANYTFTLGEDVSLALHAGHQTIKNFNALGYSDYKVGVSKPFGGFTFGAAYTSTNAADTNLYDAAANNQRKNLRGGILALSVSRSF